MVTTSLKSQEPTSEMYMNPKISVSLSQVDESRLGLWCKKKIVTGTRFGPLRGKKALEVTDRMDPAYLWEIVDIELKEFLFYIDATNPSTACWMRYLNHAPDNATANIETEQDGIDIYYRATKDILVGQELLTLTAVTSPTKRQRRGKPLIRRANVFRSELQSDATSSITRPSSSISQGTRGKGLVTRGGGINAAVTLVTSQTTEKSYSSISQRGRKRTAKRPIDAASDSDLTDVSIHNDDNSGDEKHRKRKKMKIMEQPVLTKAAEKPKDVEESNGHRKDTNMKSAASKSAVQTKAVSSLAGKSSVSSSLVPKSLENLHSSASLQLTSEQIAKFDFAASHMVKNQGGHQIFECDVCSAVYRQAYSLKRHYIRNHINEDYISRVDTLNSGTSGGSGAALNYGKNLAEKKGSNTSKVGKVEKGQSKEMNESNQNDLKADTARFKHGGDVVDAKIDDINKDSLATKKEEGNEMGIHAAEAGTVDAVRTSDEADIKVRISADDDGDDKLDTLNLEVEEIQEPCPMSWESSSASSIEEEDEEEGKNIVKGMYKCNMCELLFDAAVELKKHFATHSTRSVDRKFSCSQCLVKFNHKRNLRRHEATIHNTRKLGCKICDKHFSTFNEHRRHQRVHRSERFTRLTCSQCPATFVQSIDLKKHVRRLHPETFEECAYCSKYYTSETALALHLMKAHGKDLKSNLRAINARTNAKKSAIELDQAESRRLAGWRSEGGLGLGGAGYQRPAFACTVCRKCFTDYSNMCRHRRLAHKCGVPRPDGREDDDDDDEDLSPLDDIRKDALSGSAGKCVGGGACTSGAWEKQDALQAYFAGISRNIENNLQNYLEGKAEQLSRASSHIRWKQLPVESNLPVNPMSSLAAAIGHIDDGKTMSVESTDEIKLEEFNFPRGFHIKESLALYDVVPQSTSSLSSASIASVVSQLGTPAVASSSFTQNQQQVLNAITQECASRMQDQLPAVAVAVKGRRISSASSIQTASTAVSTASELVSDGAAVAAVPDGTLHSTTPPSTADAIKTSGSTTPAKSSNYVPATAISDATDGLPIKKYLCLVCLREFHDQSDLWCHQEERHANIDCRHVEVDMDYNALWCRRPSSVGTLNVSSCKLPPSDDELDNPIGIERVSPSRTLQCTKCKQSFESRCALHEHIFDCGDYWRNLSTRVTWVFVLRGNRLPPAAVTENMAKKRGKFQWSNTGAGVSLPVATNHETPRKHQSQTHKAVGVTQPIGSSTGVVVDGPAELTSSGNRRSSRTLTRQCSTESPPGGIIGDGLQLQHNYDDSDISYSPWRHVRRRQTAELIDNTQKCRGCEESFETILQLERHIPICSEKQRIIELNAAEEAACGAGAGDGDGMECDDKDIDPNKHMCIYCERQFTYMRTLRKHVAETCAARREIVEKGEYLDEEWEQDVTAKGQNVNGGGGGGGGASRDLSLSFSEMDTGGGGGDGEGGNRAGGNRFRRRRGNNWGYRVRTSRKSGGGFASYKSMDESGGCSAVGAPGDSLFGWEDAFLSTWKKDQQQRLQEQLCATEDKRQISSSTNSAAANTGLALFTDMVSPNAITTDLAVSSSVTNLAVPKT